MNKFILSLVASVVISVTTGCNPVQAECPVPVQSEIMREHKNTTAVNVYSVDGEQYIVAYTSVPWRMSQSEFFLSSFMGDKWILLERSPDNIVFGAYDDMDSQSVMRENNGFLKIIGGNVKTIEKMDAIDKANNGKCLSKFIKVGE
jgi:hypothetical protein